jgi:hypothetical protein
MADGEDGQQGGQAKSIMDQALAAINKAGKEAVLNKLKEILKRKQEHAKGVALCDAEAKKLVEDFEAGLL